MKNYIYYIIGITLILVGCVERKSGKKYLEDGKIEKIVVVPGGMENENILSSELFENIRYIPVETTDSFLIGRIEIILKLDNKFILVDRRTSYSVFITDSLGKKISLINKRGNAPGEYLTLSDVCVDYQNNGISLWSDMLRKSMDYDLNGNFTEEAKINIYASCMQKLSDDRFAFYTLYSSNSGLIDESMYPNIILTDKKGKAIKTADYYPSKYISRNLTSYKRFFSRPHADTASILPDHSNIIYYISENEIVPRYYIDFGEQTIDTDDYWAKMADPSYSYKDLTQYYEKKYCVIMSYKESDKYIYFAYKYFDNFYNVFYSKKTKKQIHFNSFVNDMNIRGTATNPIYMEGNKLYGTVSPNILIDLGRKYPEYKHFSDILDESDNQLIVELTLKDF